MCKLLCSFPEAAARNWVHPSSQSIAISGPRCDPVLSDWIKLFILSVCALCIFLYPVS